MASRFRSCHKDLCVALSTSNETLLCLACSLFGAGVIDKINKTAIIRQKSFEGADQLLNLVHGYLEGDDSEDQKERFETVLGLFEAEESLRDVTRRIKGQEESRSSSGRVGSTIPSQDQLLPSLTAPKVQQLPVHFQPVANPNPNPNPAHTVESSAFTEELAQDPRWYTLGILLGIPTHELEAINLNCHSQGIKKCLIELYNSMESLGKLPSWAIVTEALRRMNNNLLADEIYSNHIRPAAQISPSSGGGSSSGSSSETRRKRKQNPLEAPSSMPVRAAESQGSFDDAPSVAEPLMISDTTCQDDSIFVSEEITAAFMKISDKFATLVLQLKNTLEECKVPIRSIQCILQVRYELEPLEGEDATIDKIFARLRQHYSVLHYHVLAYLAKTFLANEQDLMQLIDDYETDVRSFEKSATLNDLMSTILEKRSTTEKHEVVEMKVREFWATIHLKKFEILVSEVLKTLHNYVSQIRVEKGCVCISWIIPNVDALKLITPQPLEFIKIIGVISLHIGDSVVYDIPGEGCDTLEAAMLQAVELKNTRAVELLLAAGCDPEVATKNGDNAVTNIVNIRDSNGTLGTMENVCVFGHNKKIEEIMSKSDPDDCSLRKCLPEDVSMETDVVEKRDSEPEETVDSLRLKVEDLEEQKNKLTEELKQIKEAELEDVPSVYRKKRAGDKYEPPRGFFLAGEVSRTDLTISNPILESADHDIKIQIDEDYWSQDPSEVLQCCLAAGLGGSIFDKPSGYIFISPVCFLSCKTDRPIEILFTIPHALVVTPSEDHLKRISIFSVHTPGISRYKSQKFIPLPTADLTMNDQNAKFSTALYEPSLFAVGFAISTGGVSPSPLPVVPLQCCLYVKYPVDVDEYLSGTDIRVCITLNLRTIETAGMKLQESTKLEKKEFILSESEVTVNGMVENPPSDWVSLREGNGLHQYIEIANGEEYRISPWQPTVFVVQCYNSKEPLRFIVSVVGEDYELVEMVITPSTLSKAARDHESKMTYSTSSQAHLTRKFPSLISEDNDDTKTEISKNYWSQYPSDVVLCQLAVSERMGCVWPSGYIFISQPIYLSCETKQPVEIHLTMPHVLVTSSENYSLRVVIFSSTISEQNLMSITTFCSLQQFSPVQISDLTMDDHNVSFTTTVSEPSLFVVGIAISTVDMSPAPLPVVPLRCLMLVTCSSNLDDYLSGTDICVHISMDLKNQNNMLTRLRYMDAKEEQQKFILSGPVLSVKGVLENSPSDGWQSVRRGGKGSYRYDEIAVSERWNRKRFTYPPNVHTSFFVKCFNPKEPLKFRVTVLCHNNNELVNMLLTVSLTEGTETQSDELSDTTNSNLFSPSGTETQSDELSDTTNTET